MIFLPEFDPPPGPPDERFSELFKAAHVLLREDVDEDQIIPTLIAAHEISHGVHRWVSAKEEIIQDSLSRPPHTRNLSVVKVVDGTLVLEREPVLAEFVSSSWSADVSEPLTARWLHRTRLGLRNEQPPYRDGVLIRVYPHKRRIEPVEITSRYEEMLETEGRSWSNPYNALTEYEFTGACLYLLVAPGVKYPIDFPPPSLVKNFWKGLAEIEKRLMARRGRGGMKAKNLIPACVAFLLIASGGPSSPKEIEQLVHNHVFGEEGEYLLAGTSASPNVQLWRDVKKVPIRIMRGLATM
jgi:hypothetical protein